MTKEKEESYTSFTPEEFFKAVLSSSSTTVNPDTLLVQKIDNIHKKGCRGTHLKPKEADLRSFFEPTVSCFCKRSAHKYYTLDYGPILECASYNKSSSWYNEKYICGFHVHEIPWMQLYKNMKEGYSICSRYMELRACPLFNFTYCTAFKVVNEYSSNHIIFPNCFCNKPVKIVQEPERGTLVEPTIITNFICANRNIPGVTKCSWLNSVDKSVFPKPKHQLHREVDIVTYIRNRDNARADYNCSIGSRLLHNCLD